MYCIKCGVELAESEKCCPLCGTDVFHPDLDIKFKEKNYPTRLVNAVNTINVKGILFLITVGFFIASVILFLCDINIDHNISWFGYAAGGLFAFYIFFVLPCWFKNPNPIIFVPVDFCVTACLLLYISLASKGGWFLSFAFPVCGALGLITTTTVTLFKYLKKGYFYVTGGLIISLGLVNLLIEFLIDITFKTGNVFSWSLYPATVGFLIGMALIVIAICRPLRVSLHKKFFI